MVWQHHDPSPSQSIKNSFARLDMTTTETEPNADYPFKGRWRMPVILRRHQATPKWRDVKDAP